MDQDPGFSQKTDICLRRRKRLDVLHIEIDYFINRLIKNQPASSLPAWTPIQ